MSLRILILEDDTHIRLLIERYLTADPALAARTLELTMASDGKAGWEALDRGPYDLVISDLLMPRVDGFAFARSLRKHPHGATVPLIILSAIYKDQQTIAQLQKEVGAQFFAKPFVAADLLAAVKRAVGDGESSARTTPVETTSGKLNALSPPPLLLDLWEKRATGRLLLQRARVSKEISLLAGSPISVQSNLRTETLGHLLVARGLIDEKQHQMALKWAQAEKQRLGQALVHFGWLSEAELMTQLGAQMRAKVVHVLRWQEGDWRFTPGPPTAPPLQTPVEAPHLIFAGLQKTAQIDRIAQTLAPVRGQLTLTARGERLREWFGRVFGDGLLTALPRRPLLGELLAVSDPAPVLIQIDALLVCGMAELQIGADDRKPLLAKPDPLALERLPARTPPAATGAGTLHEELFGADSPEPAPQEFDDHSGTVITFARPVPGLRPAPANEAPAVTKLRNELLGEYLAIQGKDHYQVLRLSPQATAEEIATAYATLSRKFRAERFASVDLGPDQARIGEIQQIFRSAFETLSSREARAAYDAQIEGSGRSSEAALDADLLAQQAMSQIATGAYGAAPALLQRAVSAAPDQPDYHAMLGWAVYHAEGATAAAAASAWTHLQTALEIDPDHLDAHDYAGRIAAAVGDDARAIAHLTRVLDADAERTEALTAIEAACTRLGEDRQLEHQYRKLIHRLAEAPTRAQRIWLRLAEHYRTRLNDLASAKVAYEQAARLAPNDPRPRQALMRLLTADPSTWREAAVVMRDTWRLSPGDPSPGHALFRLHRDGQRWDAAYVVAAALAVRQAGDALSNEFLQRFKPRFLMRARPAFDDARSLRDRVRHPEDDETLSELFARIFAVWQPPGEEAAIDANDHLAPEALPPPFARLHRYCAEQLGMTALPVYRRAHFCLEMQIATGAPPRLWVGAQALALAEPSDLAFRLGRALSYLDPGRALAAALTPRQLRQVLSAALSLAVPSLVPDDADGEVQALRASLAAATPRLASELAPLCERLLKGAQTTLNLARYARALFRTGDRVGLVLCNDLATAVGIAVTDGTPGAEDDLIDFALSEEYLAARAALGLSIEV